MIIPFFLHRRQLVALYVRASCQCSKETYHAGISDVPSTRPRSALPTNRFLAAYRRPRSTGKDLKLVQSLSRHHRRDSVSARTWQSILPAVDSLARFDVHSSLLYPSATPALDGLAGDVRGQVGLPPAACQLLAAQSSITKLRPASPLRRFVGSLLCFGMLLFQQTWRVGTPNSVVVCTPCSAGIVSIASGPRLQRYTRCMQKAGKGSLRSIQPSSVRVASQLASSHVRSLLWTDHHTTN